MRGRILAMPVARRRNELPEQQATQIRFPPGTPARPSNRRNFRKKMEFLTGKLSVFSFTLYANVRIKHSLERLPESVNKLSDGNEMGECRTKSGIFVVIRKLFRLGMCQTLC
jgi:hypothetical protein